MKKILIIEDNQIVANVYRNKLAVEDYQTEVALDGETGLKIMRSFQPDIMILDLMLPKMSGVDVIKQVRSEADFAKLPIIVFSNTYLTNLIQEAWKAGANKCLSKASCSPQEVLDIVRNTVGDSGSMPKTRSVADDLAEKKAQAGKLAAGGGRDDAFQAGLQKSFIDSLPATLGGLRAGMQALVKAGDEMAQLKQIYELYRRLHTLTGNAGIAGLTQISKMSDAVEALLKELYEKPKNINSSTLRTVAAGVDFLGFLFERGIAPEKQDIPAANILVVDDEPISRRAIVYSLEKAHLQSITAEDPNVAFKLLAEKEFDLVFLDIDMPGMTGHELCAKLRALPQHKKTPVVFVTGLSDFDSRTSSMIAGGNDFIAKPFLFIELTVKALIHILRARLQPVK
jgi:DNA-binding response OmpR family regulator